MEAQSLLGASRGIIECTLQSLTGWKFDAHFGVERQIRITPAVQRFAQDANGSRGGAGEQRFAGVCHRDRLIEIGHPVIEADEQRRHLLGRGDL